MKIIKSGICIEDIRQKPILRIPKRSFSCSDLSKVANLDQEMRGRTSALWECIDSFPSRLGGRIYRYVSKKEGDDFTDPDEGGETAEEINARLYPAIEPSALAVSTFIIRKNFSLWLQNTMLAFEERLKERDFSFFQDEDLKDLVQKKLEPIKKELTKAQKDAHLLKKLGFRVFTRDSYDETLLSVSFLRKEKALDLQGDIFCDLPDLEALQQGCLRNRDLEIVDLVSSKGIANDLDFFFSWIHSDGLLSNEKEFVHDIHVHLISSIRISLDLKKSGFSYQKEKFRIVKLALLLFRRYEMARDIAEAVSLEDRLCIQKNHGKMKVLLGVLIDTIFSYYDASEIRSVYKENHMKKICLDIWKEEHPLSLYLERRFKEKPSLQEAIHFWDAIKRNATYLDEQRILQKQNNANYQK